MTEHSLIVTIDPCCCGCHVNGDEGMVTHPHHSSIYAIPSGFCERRSGDCPQCKDILDKYFDTIGKPEWKKR